VPGRSGTKQPHAKGKKKKHTAPDLGNGRYIGATRQNVEGTQAAAQKRPPEYAGGGGKSRSLRRAATNTKKIPLLGKKEPEVFQRLSSLRDQVKHRPRILRGKKAEKKKAVKNGPYPAPGQENRMMGGPDRIAIEEPLPGTSGN